MPPRPRNDRPSPPARAPWDAAGALATPVLAAVGLLVYGTLVLAYSEFFQELGINPADVGLDYAKPLAGAAGLTLLWAFAAVLGTLVLYGGVAVLKRAWPASVPAIAREREWPFLVAGGVLAYVALLVLLHNKADSYADRLKRGRHVEPYKLPLPWFDLELLAVHGDPVVVEPMRTESSTNRASASQFRVDGETLGAHVFYIGQAKGVAVLYDAHGQRVIYVPTSNVVLRTVNCETSRAENDPLCVTTDRELPPPDDGNDAPSSG